MDAKEIMERLQDPFPPEEIEWRVGSTNGDKTKGIALAYVTNRAIQNRLDSVFGPFGWKNEFREWKGSSQICGISVKFDGEWITKWDGADDSNTEAVKGGLSDAMKRAAYQWGIGRYLYNLENVWVPIRQQGKSYVLASEPRLPAWALPRGYEYNGSPRNTQAEPPSEPTETFPPTERALPRDRQQNGNTGQSGTAKDPSKRVFGLMNEMGWQFVDVQNFASDLFDRQIRHLKNQIKEEDEWNQLYDGMKRHKETGWVPKAS